MSSHRLLPHSEHLGEAVDWSAGLTEQTAESHPGRQGTASAMVQHPLGELSFSCDLTVADTGLCLVLSEDLVLFISLF